MKKIILFFTLLSCMAHMFGSSSSSSSSSVGAAPAAVKSMQDVIASAAQGSAAQAAAVNTVSSTASSSSSAAAHSDDTNKRLIDENLKLKQDNKVLTKELAIMKAFLQSYPDGQKQYKQYEQECIKKQKIQEFYNSWDKRIARQRDTFDKKKEKEIMLQVRRYDKSAEFLIKLYPSDSILAIYQRIFYKEGSRNTATVCGEILHPNHLIKDYPALLNGNLVCIERFFEFGHVHELVEELR